MVDNQHKFITKGASLTRPPGFAEENYPYQKDIMEMYIKSTQYEIQLMITNRDIPIHKPEDEWTDDDLVIMELKTKARYTLTCALSKNDYNKIYRLRTAKEVWNLLSINYEGTKDVKLKKATTLTRHYESFNMKDREFVDDMFG